MADTGRFPVTTFSLAALLVISSVAAFFAFERTTTAKSNTKLLSAEDLTQDFILARPYSNWPKIVASSDPNPLDSFRKLIGILYGGAGLAHLADLLVGPSALLVAAGPPMFADLTPQGQAFALLWCAAGPVSFAASRADDPLIADAGLVFYGLVEVVGAFLTPRNSEAFTNALLLQGVVLATWLYSSKKNESMWSASHLGGGAEVEV
jgi:hypothetical protein